jgi:carboxypeptidase Q
MRYLGIVCFAATALLAQEHVDYDVVHKIKTEALDHSKVMDTLGNITDLYGPRLTGSPQFQKAADWTLARFKEWGLENAHAEKWGPFGRSWEVVQHSLEMTSPSYAVLTAYPLAWTDSTPGTIAAEVVYAPLSTRAQRFDPKKTAEDVDRFIGKYKGQLKGKIVLLSASSPIPNETEAQFRRDTEERLHQIADAPEPMAKVEIDPNHIEVPEDPEKANQFFNSLPDWMFMKLFDQLTAQHLKLYGFLRTEGALGVLTTDRRSVTGTVFAEAAASEKAKEPLALPSFAVTREQYNRLVRLTEKKVTVAVRMNLKVNASSSDVDGLNLIAEIPGKSRKDELVMIGAHFDSWHTGTGATDNGAGSAVMMEVMRILKALNLKLERTVRIGLWSGEEQGLYGSQAYVKEHFGDFETMHLTEQHAKLCAYFNLDNGSGKIRGVYLQGNDAARPIFEQWFAPFRDLGAGTISIRNTGGTDHLSFDAVGLPGFQFIQDPLAYGTITHHSDMDVYDEAQAPDLMQASAIIASFVYNAANRAEMMPRKPLPEPVKH